MKTLLIFSIALAVGTGSGMADEQVRRIQEELRKRRVYFGEIDGKKTEETIRALQAYQKRKGFNPTGEPDADTLAALNIADPAKPTDRWPDVPVLKSDTARRLKEEERKILEELAIVGEPPGLDDESEGADARLDAAAKPASEGTRLHPPNTEKELRARAEEFVQQYLNACETNDLDAEMAFYADRVRYFDHGLSETPFIRQDVAAFYKRWPKRSYHLYDLKVLAQRGDETIVKFRIGFQYRSPNHRVAGKTDNVFSIQDLHGKAKFTSLREQRIRD